MAEDQLNIDLRYTVSGEAAAVDAAKKVEAALSAQNRAAFQAAAASKALGEGNRTMAQSAMVSLRGWDQLSQGAKDYVRNLSKGIVTINSMGQFHVKDMTKLSKILQDLDKQEVRSHAAKVRESRQLYQLEARDEKMLNTVKESLTKEDLARMEREDRAVRRQVRENAQLRKMEAADARALLAIQKGLEVEFEAMLKRENAAVRQQVLEIQRAKALEAKAWNQGKAAMLSLIGSGGPMMRLAQMANMVRYSMYGLASSFTVREIVRYGVEYNRIINTLSAGMGNLHKAMGEWKFLSEFAKKYSVDLFAVSTEYAKFIAAVKGTKLAGQPAREIFESLAKATLVLGLSADRTERAFLALSQMASQTYVTAENLRQQFAEHIPGAMILAAQAMGMTNDAFYKALYSGNVLATDLLPKLQKVLEDIYGPHAERAANTMIGSVNRLKTAWEKTLAALAEGAPGRSLRDIMQRLTDILGLIEKYPAKVEEITNALSVLARAFLLIWGSQKILQGMVSMWNWLGKIRLALLGIVALAGTAGAVVTGGVAGLAVGLGGGLLYVEKKKEDLESMDDALRNTRKALSDFNAEVMRLEALEKKSGKELPLATKLSTLEPILVDARASFDLLKEMLASPAATDPLLQIEGWDTAVGYMRQGLQDTSMQLRVIEQMMPALRERADLEGKITEETETQKSHMYEVKQAYYEMKEKELEIAREHAMKIGDYGLARDLIQHEIELNNEKLEVLNRYEDKNNKIYDHELEMLKKIEARKISLTRFGEIDLAIQAKINAENQKRLSAQEALNAKIQKQAETVDEALAQAYAALAEQQSKINIEKETPLETGARRAAEAIRELRLKTEEYFAALNEEGLETYEAMLAKIYELTKQTEALKSASQEWEESMAHAFVELMNESVRDVQNTFSKFFSDLLSGSKSVWEDMTNALLDMFIKMISDMLANWLTFELTKTAITAQQAAKRAGIDAAASGQSSSGVTSSSMSAYWGVIKGLWKWFGGASGSTAAGTSAAGWSQLNAVSVGPSGGVTTTGAWSGGTGAQAAGGLSAGAWFSIFAAAIVVGLTLYGNKNRRNRTFGTAAGAEFDPTTGMLNVGWGGKLDKTGPLVAQKLGDLLKALEAGSGAFFTGLDKITIQIRNDKKEFKAFVDGQLIGYFYDMNSAIVAAAKKAFASAEFSAAVDPMFMGMVERFQGTDPEALMKAAEITKGILDVASGMSDLGLQIQNLIPSIHNMASELRNLGVSVEDASMISMRFAANQFIALHRQITGEKETPKEELERRKKEAELFNAQLKLYRLELQARAAYLRGQLELAKKELEINKQALDAKGVYMRGKIKLEQSEASLAYQDLLLQRQELEAKIKLFETELKVLEEIDKILEGLDIDIGKIKIDGGNGPGSHASKQRIRMIDALESLRDFQKRLVMGEMNPGGLEARTSAARSEYERIKALATSGNKVGIAGFGEAAEAYLELYRQTYGGAGAGYANLFNEINSIASSILRAHGIAPVTSFASAKEQADYTAKAFGNQLPKDSSGRLKTADTQTKASVDEVKKAQNVTNDNLRELISAVNAQTVSVVQATSLKVSGNSIGSSGSRVA